MSPETKPLLVYDGDCVFCLKWVKRWNRITRDQVYYAPYQKVSPGFPSIPVSQFEKAVQLITPEGKVYSAAEAVFRTLAYVPGWKWPLWIYLHVPGFRWMSELAYRLVAANRGFFSRWTP